MRYYDGFYRNNKVIIKIYLGHKNFRYSYLNVISVLYYGL